MNELENDEKTNEYNVGKASFPNASRLQQSHVQTANIAFRLKRRVQWHTVSGRRTYSTRKSIFKRNPKRKSSDRKRGLYDINLTR